MSSIQILVYEPTSHRGELRESDGSLEAMQELVGGYIEERILTGDRSVVAILNEDGLPMELPANRCARQFGWVGTFCIVRVLNGKPVSLTDDDVAMLREKFDQPLHS